jgi:PAS domain S-box-containing protein
MEQISAETAKFQAMAHWYESILDAIPFGVSIQDPEEKRSFVNAALENLIGKKRQEVIGSTCREWGVSICSTDECARTCAKRGQSQTYFLHEGKSYQIDVAVLTDMHGAHTGYLELIQDITRLEQMTKQQAEAEAASHAKSAFLAKMSHEIRTPMNAIVGITEMQLQYRSLSQETKEAFTKIYSSAYTLLGIINDLLDLAKIEAGRMTLIPSVYELASLLNDTVQLNMVRIGRKPLTFMLQVDEHAPLELYGDELRIKQILNNLLSNAFKYTSSGEVTLSVSAEYGNRTDDPDVTLVFSVSDTGQGMTSEQVRDIYDEYSRFNLQANRMIEGTGLGMNITQHLLHMMKGKIIVESEPGRGSTFTVRLPQTRVGSSCLGRELATNLQQFKTDMTHIRQAPSVRELMPYGSVLVVDDMETNLYVTRGLLAPYGLSIDTVASGLEAIGIIRGGKTYDIVFMDHMMPGMDGVEATKILRELNYTGSIVAFTANIVIGQAEMFLENGFDDVLSKPIDLRKLNCLLNRLIRDKQPREVIELARRQKDDAKATPEPLDGQLTKIFMRDAEKAIATMEAIYINRSRSDNDRQQYVISAHAMKSALANIGKKELSAVALKLEQAGRAGNVDEMLDETPAFLNALRALVEEITPREEDGDEDEANAGEDRAYLCEQLLDIQAACAEYDKKAAKTALRKLQEKTWPRPAREQLDAITGYLLHSAFDDVADVAAMLLAGENQKRPLDILKTER